MENIFNNDSICWQRMFQGSMKKIKSKFQSNTSFVIHWDGENVSFGRKSKSWAMTSILISGKIVSQQLTVAKTSSTTREIQATAVFENILDWEIAHNFHTICFDTTSIYQL